jgi:hypothetical protein
MRRQDWYNGMKNRPVNQMGIEKFVAIIDA